MIVRPARPADAAAIAAIYGHYVRDTIVSLEEVPPGADEMARRMATVRPPHLYLVAEEGGALLGYAYGNTYNARSAYRWTCETTIYLDPARRGGGVGRTLYGALLDGLRATGVLTCIAGITLPNPESAGFHEALGFRPVGRMRDVGYKFGRWYDVGYWQRDLAARPDVPAEPQRG